MNKNTEEPSEIPQPDHRDSNANIDYSHPKTNQWEPHWFLGFLINGLLTLYVVGLVIFGIVVATAFGIFG